MTCYLKRSDGSVGIIISNTSVGLQLMHSILKCIELLRLQCDVLEKLSNFGPRSTVDQCKLFKTS